MFDWFRTVPLLGKLLAVGLAVLLMVLVLNALERKEDKDNANLVQQGELKERSVSQSEVINNVEKARDATDRPTDAERSNVCAKYDRNCPDG